MSEAFVRCISSIILCLYDSFFFLIMFLSFFLLINKFSLILASRGFIFTCCATMLTIFLAVLHSLSNHGLSDGLLPFLRFLLPSVGREFPFEHSKRALERTEIPFSGDRFVSRNLFSNMALFFSVVKASRKDVLTVSFHLQRGGSLFMTIVFFASVNLFKFNLILYFNGQWSDKQGRKSPTSSSVILSKFVTLVIT